MPQVCKTSTGTRPSRRPRCPRAANGGSGRDAREAQGETGSSSSSQRGRASGRPRLRLVKVGDAPRDFLPGSRQRAGAADGVLPHGTGPDHGWARSTRGQIRLSSHLPVAGPSRGRAVLGVSTPQRLLHSSCTRMASSDCCMCINFRRHGLRPATGSCASTSSASQEDET